MTLFKLLLAVSGYIFADFSANNEMSVIFHLIGVLLINDDIFINLCFCKIYTSSWFQYISLAVLDQCFLSLRHPLFAVDLLKCVYHLVIKFLIYALGGVFFLLGVYLLHQPIQEFHNGFIVISILSVSENNLAIEKQVMLEGVRLVDRFYSLI